MSTFTIRQIAGDSGGTSDSGQTSVTNTSNNFIRINSQAVNHNSSVVATTAPGTTPGDITIYSGNVVYTNVIGMEFICTLVASNANALIPQVYLKFVGAHGSSHDIVLPMNPGQIWTWLNPASTINSVNNVNIPNNTYDANGNAFTLESSAVLFIPVLLGANITDIIVTPDKYSDVSISGTIELDV
jgi:hypothetical protein